VNLYISNYPSEMDPAYNVESLPSNGFSIDYTQPQTNTDILSLNSHEEQTGNTHDENSQTVLDNTVTTGQENVSIFQNFTLQGYHDHTSLSIPNMHSTAIQNHNSSVTGDEMSRNASVSSAITLVDPYVPQTTNFDQFNMTSNNSNNSYQAALHAMSPPHQTFSANYNMLPAICSLPSNTTLHSNAPPTIVGSNTKARTPPPTPPQTIFSGSYQEQSGNTTSGSSGYQLSLMNYLNQSANVQSSMAAYNAGYHTSNTMTPQLQSMNMYSSNHQPDHNHIPMSPTLDAQPPAAAIDPPSIRKRKSSAGSHHSAILKSAKQHAANFNNVDLTSIPSTNLNAISENSKHTCSTCSKSFPTPYALKSHMKCHEAPSLSCPACPLTFRRNHDLVRHTRSVHDGGVPHPCPFCEKGFARADALRRHLETKSAHRCTGLRPMSGTNSGPMGSVSSGFGGIAAPGIADISYSRYTPF
jgi:hypothetical protein